MNIRTISLALFAGTLATSAFAHATLEVKEAPAASYYKAVVKIGHGCDGEPTTTVRITIPEGIISVKPRPKAGWNLEITKGDYDNAYELHGREITAGVKQITWTGKLPDEWYDEFSFNAYLTDRLPAGKKVFIPVVQECPGAEMAWAEIPAEGQNPHELARPAPALLIAQASGKHAMAHVIKAGDLEIETPVARATPPNAPVAGGYLTIRNTGLAADRLVGGTATFAGKVEVHEMTMKDDVMKMRALADGLEIQAGAEVMLKPGGFHIMFMQLREQLKAGETRAVTLHFERAGEVELHFDVKAIGRDGMKHGKTDHSKHGN